MSHRRRRNHRPPPGSGCFLYEPWEYLQMTSTRTSVTSGSSSLRSRLQSASACSPSDSTYSPGFSDRRSDDDERIQHLTDSMFGYENLPQQLFAEGGRPDTPETDHQPHQKPSP